MADMLVGNSSSQFNRLACIFGLTGPKNPFSLTTKFARGGIREHDAFLGHEMRGPAGTGRGGVSMAWGREGKGRRKGNGVRGHRLPSLPCFV